MACSCCYESAFTTPSPETQIEICNADIGAVVVTADDTVYVRVTQSSPCANSDFVEVGGSDLTVQGTNTCAAGGIGNAYSIASANVAGGILTLNGQPEHTSFHVSYTYTAENPDFVLPTTAGGTSQFYNPAFDEGLGILSNCRTVNATAIINPGVIRVNANQNALVDYTLQYREVFNGVPIGVTNAHRITQSHPINGTLRYAMPTWATSIQLNGLTEWYVEIRLTREGGTLVTTATWENPGITFIYNTEG